MTREKLRQNATALMLSALLTLSVAPPAAAAGSAVQIARATTGSFMGRLYQAVWDALEALGLRFQDERENRAGTSATEPSPGLAAKYGSSYDPFG